MGSALPDPPFALAGAEPGGLDGDPTRAIASGPGHRRRLTGDAPGRRAYVRLGAD